MFAHAPGAGSTNAPSAGDAANDEEYEPPKEEVKIVSIFIFLKLSIMTISSLVTNETIKLNLIIIYFLFLLLVVDINSLGKIFNFLLLIIFKMNFGSIIPCPFDYS